ncbi:Uncharacterised protein [uncultured archaeon]|nr:Uncharacterised protein [uncultured archaeon]
MKSLAIARSTDILKLKSTLLEMNGAGLSFEIKPKEINPEAAERILSPVFESPCNKYEVCAMIAIMQDEKIALSRIKTISHSSDVIIIGNSHELFDKLVKLLPVLPDLVIPNVFDKDANKLISDPKAAPVYLGVFVGRKVQVQTESGSIYSGVLKHADSAGVLFEPADNSPFFITWHEIKKVIIPKEEKNGNQ